MKLPVCMAPALAAALVHAGPLPAQRSSEVLELSVLYAGDVEHPRTSTWVRFLERHTRGVEAIDLSELSRAAAVDHDVVIVDSPSPFGEEGRFDMPEVPALSRDFDRPTILVGAAGGALLRKVKIKLDWL